MIRSRPGPCTPAARASSSRSPQATGIGRDDYAISQEVLGEFGNMSSPTILFILERLRQRGAPRPCLALGFGPGLAVEAALFR